jgi:protein-S-isoprenylcysteine O-methyltransferase Ste14
VTTVAIHHAIIRREEEFLEGRFGAAWRSYVAVTPRYVGMSGLRKSKQTP